jgi:hypothetical protein
MNRLPVGKKQFYFLLVCLVNQMPLPQRPFPLGGLLRHNMVGMGLSVYQFAGSCFLEPFGCRAVCFDFWHVSLLLTCLHTVNGMVIILQTEMA